MLVFCFVLLSFYIRFLYSGILFEEIGRGGRVLVETCIIVVWSL